MIHAIVVNHTDEWYGYLNMNGKHGWPCLALMVLVLLERIERLEDPHKNTNNGEHSCDGFSIVRNKPAHHYPQPPPFPAPSGTRQDVEVAGTEDHLLGKLVEECENLLVG